MGWPWRGLARAAAEGCFPARVIENRENVGFGRAVNQAAAESSAPFLAVLNDDAEASPGWIEALLEAAGNDPETGMWASKVLLAGEDRLDSAGMLICADGSSKQRGHGEPPGKYCRLEEVLLPSGSAAMYRRGMLEEIGLFDEDFFLYCEDTDLGLRARRAGWRCMYVPDAVVEHAYSGSAGRASPLKAYYVERNRLFVAVKNFPAGGLLAAPLVSLARYFWHVLHLARGRGAAADFRRGGHSAARLVWYVWRAHLALLAALPRLLAQRAAIRRGAKLTAAEFRALLGRDRKSVV